MSTTELATVETAGTGGMLIKPKSEAAAAALAALPPEAVQAVQEIAMKRQMVLAVMHQLMVDGLHYGVIPGTKKPTLLKPGAELLCQTFGFSQKFVTEREDYDMHRVYTVVCHLDDKNGAPVSEGGGVCSTYEKKYRWRTTGVLCPECGSDTVKRSGFPENVAPEKRGYYCHEKAGGCNAKFPATDTRITEQKREKVENPDLADHWNTCKKMADKRALVAATLIGTGASELFTQDVEDFPEMMRNVTRSAPDHGETAVRGGGNASRRQELLKMIDGHIGGGGFSDGQRRWVALQVEDAGEDLDKLEELASRVETTAADLRAQRETELAEVEAELNGTDPVTISDDLQERVQLVVDVKLDAERDYSRAQDAKGLASEDDAREFLKKWESIIDNGGKPPKAAAAEGCAGRHAD